MKNHLPIKRLSSTDAEGVCWNGMKVRHCLVGSLRNNPADCRNAPDSGCWYAAWRQGYDKYNYAFAYSVKPNSIGK
jgi:hypothetical protein